MYLSRQLYQELFYDIFTNCALPCNKCTRYLYHHFPNRYGLLCRKHADNATILYYLVANNNYQDISLFFRYFKFEFNKTFYFVQNQQVYLQNQYTLRHILEQLGNHESYYHD